jgi:hypothetical protein
VHVLSGGLAGVSEGDFSGRLYYQAPTEPGTSQYLTTQVRRVCAPSPDGSATTAGTYSAAQMARLQPGGDLYRPEYSPVEHEGNICLWGTVDREDLVSSTQAVPGTPGGWYFDMIDGRTAKVLNPLPAWGTPGGDTEGRRVTLTGRLDDRTIPAAFQVVGEATGGNGSGPLEQVYFDPDAPVQLPDDRTEIADISPERVAELRAEQALEAERLRRELEARRELEERQRAAEESDPGGDGGFVRSDAGPWDWEAMDPGGRRWVPLALAGVGLFLLLGRRRR